jgi:hypothetical protein
MNQSVTKMMVIHLHHVKNRRKTKEGGRCACPSCDTNDPDIITDNNLVTIGCFVVVRPKQADEGRFWIGQVEEVIKSPGRKKNDSVVESFNVTYFVLSTERGPFHQEYDQREKLVRATVPVLQIVAAFRQLDPSNKIPSNIFEYVDREVDKMLFVEPNLRSKKRAGAAH